MLGCTFLTNHLQGLKSFYFFTHTAGNQQRTGCDTPACWSQKVHLATSVQFFFPPQSLATILLDGLWLVLGRHYV